MGSSLLNYQILNLLRFITLIVFIIKSKSLDAYTSHQIHKLSKKF